MHKLKLIREALGVTQQALADGIGCTQGNIGHYERGQTVPPETAKRVIGFCRSAGLRIGFDHIYGEAAIPVKNLQLLRTPKRKEVAHG